VRQAVTDKIHIDVDEYILAVNQSSDPDDLLTVRAKYEWEWETMREKVVENSTELDLKQQSRLKKLIKGFQSNLQSKTRWAREGPQLPDHSGTDDKAADQCLAVPFTRHAEQRVCKITTRCRVSSWDINRRSKSWTRKRRKYDDLMTKVEMKKHKRI
jgi:hypothetical protein